MKKLLVLPFLFFSLSIFAQNSIGFEAQVYPAGVVPALRFDFLLNHQFTLTTRVGYNKTNRRDWGEHDNEEGAGLGFGLGLEQRSFFNDQLSLHVRVDLWFLDIDWRTDRQLCNLTQCGPTMSTYGESSITVMQPTVGLVYTKAINDRFLFKPSLSLGYEINIRTKGEAVGEGAILLAGFQIAYLPFAK